MQVNLLYLAMTRAKHLLVVNGDMRDFLRTKEAWNSVSLRAVTKTEPEVDATLSAPGNLRDNPSSTCNICGRAVSGDGTSFGGPGEGLLLYAECETDKPLCRSCVEDDPRVACDILPHMVAPRHLRSIRPSFPYVRALMRASSPVWRNVAFGQFYLEH